MTKRIAAILLAILLLLAMLTACGASKIVHCDHCGEEVEIKADSNMEEDWIIYCAQCNEELFGDDPLLGG